MLRLVRRHVEPANRPAGVADGAASPGGPALIAALTTLAARRLDGLHIPEGAAGEALRALVGRIERDARADLACLSTLAAETAETATNIGWITHDIRDVADNTASVASAVDKLAASVGELSTSSAASADEAVDVRRETEFCVGDMRSAGESMQLIRTRVGAMRERLSVLETAVQQIADMAETIATISSQTNLLALNATIEAARAGEAGRGFAVVANEVKSLSGQTAKATEQIRTRLATLTNEMAGIKLAMNECDESVASGAMSVKAADSRVLKIGERMDAFSATTATLAGVLREQRAATGDMSGRVGKIAAKAKKTRSEIDGCLERLLKAETAACAAIQSAHAKGLPAFDLLSARANLTAWKRKLAAVLVGLVKPTLDLVDREPRRLARWAETAGDPGIRAHAAFSAVQSAEASAHDHARRLIEAVRAGQWKAATDAYMAADAAIAEAIAAAGKLVEVAYSTSTS
jgi:chromosome segregation ATPase